MNDITFIIAVRKGSQRVKNKNIETYGENSQANYKVSNINFVKSVIHLERVNYRQNRLKSQFCGFK